MSQSNTGQGNKAAQYPGAASAGQGPASRVGQTVEPWERVLGSLGSRIASRYSAVTEWVRRHTTPPLWGRSIRMNYTPALEQKVSEKALWSDTVAQRAGGFSRQISSTWQSIDFLCEPPAFVWFSQREMEGWQQRESRGYVEQPIIRADRAYKADSTPPTAAATDHSLPTRATDFTAAHRQSAHQHQHITSPEQRLQSRGIPSSQHPASEEGIPMPRSVFPATQRAAPAKSSAALPSTGHPTISERPLSAAEGGPAETRTTIAKSGQGQDIRGTTGKEDSPVWHTHHERGAPSDTFARILSRTSPARFFSPGHLRAMPLAMARSSVTPTTTSPSLLSREAKGPDVHPRALLFPYLPLSSPETVSPAEQETQAPRPQENFLSLPSAATPPTVGYSLPCESGSKIESAFRSSGPMVLHRSPSTTPAIPGEGSEQTGSPEERQTAIWGQREHPAIPQLHTRGPSVADLVVNRWSHAILRRQPAPGPGALPSAMYDALVEAVAGKYRRDNEMGQPVPFVTHSYGTSIQGKAELPAILRAGSGSPFEPPAFEGEFLPPAPYPGSTPLQRSAEGFYGTGASMSAPRFGSPVVYPAAFGMEATEMDSDIGSLPTHLPSRIAAADSRLRGYDSLQLVLATFGGGSSRDRNSQELALAPVDRPSRGSSSQEAAEGAAGEVSREGSYDLEAMAREVYAILKRRFAVERERRACV